MIFGIACLEDILCHIFIWSILSKCGGLLGNLTPGDFQFSLLSSQMFNAQSMVFLVVLGMLLASARHRSALLTGITNLLESIFKGGAPNYEWFVREAGHVLLKFHVAALKETKRHPCLLLDLLRLRFVKFVVKVSWHGKSV